MYEALFGGVSEAAASVMVGAALVILFVFEVWRRRRNHLELREAQAKSAALAERVRALEGMTLPIAGVDAEEKSWEITVGGEKVELRAMPALEYARALQELPEFLFAYAKRKEQQQDLSEAELETLVERAKRWIGVSAVGEVRLERLSVPEALNAVVVISRMNGIHSSLAAYFQGHLGDSHAGLGGEALQRKTQHAAPS